jgi:hypothetical protein
MYSRDKELPHVNIFDELKEIHLKRGVCLWSLCLNVPRRSR